MKALSTALSAATLFAVAAGAMPALARVQRRPVFVEYGRPPEAIEELADDVDVVVVGQVEAWRPEKHVASDATRPTLMTAYQVSVVELLKDDGRIAPGTRTITVVRVGGVSEDGTRESWTPEFEPFKQGESLLLFLRWTPQFGGYSIAYGPDGAYAIEDSVVRPFGQSPVAERQRGRPSSDLLASLRARGKGPRKNE